ncbi:fumarate hydratase [Candidatus Bathyarchaeota archaeon]|nr:fumarate hydratase [Candidatus Bathyarchaeota archaeon]
MKEKLENHLINLIKKAEVTLPKDVFKALKKAYKKENSPLGKAQLKIMIENVKLAEKLEAPICQDTGVINFFIKFGSKFKIDFNIKEVVFKAVRKATEEIPLRPSIVHPLTRINSSDNTGRLIPFIYLEQVEGDFMEVTVSPKGAGSENLSILKIFNPNDDVEVIKKFILNFAAEKIGKACPPGRIGVGIGGTADLAQFLSKKALLRAIGKRNEDNEIAKLEENLLNLINKLGIGPMGLGGEISVFDVGIEYASCHTASLPVGISFQCWVDRRASLKIYSNGEVEELEDSS